MKGVARSSLQILSSRATACGPSDPAKLWPKTASFSEPPGAEGHPEILGDKGMPPCADAPSKK